MDEDCRKINGLICAFIIIIHRSLAYCFWSLNIMTSPLFWSEPLSRTTCFVQYRLSPAELSPKQISDACKMPGSGWLMTPLVGKGRKRAISP